MRFAEGAVEDFANFCKENIKYWMVDGKYNALNSRKVILVDLMLKDGNILIRPLILAKFLQKHYGYKIVGLVGITDLIRAMYDGIDSENTPVLANSYDITELLDLSTPANEDFSIHVADGDRYSELAAFDLAAEIDGCDEDEAKRRILGWRSESGAHIGHHILTTSQRVAKSAQFEIYKAILPRVVKETFYIHNIFDHLFQRYDIAATITTHLCYNIFGLLSEISLQNGAPVFHARHESDLSVAVLREPPAPSETLGTLSRKAEASIFHDYVWPNRDRLRATTEKVLALLNTGEHLLPPWWVKPRTGNGKVGTDRREIMRRLGWTEDKPVYAIMNHAMTDDVYCDTQAFNDCHDWLRRTLAFAAEDDSRYWLVKRHPHDAIYDGTNTFNLLARKYHALPHIRFIADGLTKAELFAVTSLALTVRGSLGYDFAAAGVPVILSGRSRMSDIGFASIADDADTYFDLLQKPVEALAITTEQIERAQLYIMFGRLIAQIPSGFFPSLNAYTASEPGLWDAMRRRLMTATVERDEFYRNMVRCLDVGLPWIFNIEFLQLVNDSQTFLPEVADSARARA
jgi:hypothetical protein